MNEDVSISYEKYWVFVSSLQKASLLESKSETPGRAKATIL